MGESIKNIWGLTGEHLRQMMIWGFQALVLAVPLVFTSAIQEYSTPKIVVAEIMAIVLAIFWLLSMVLDGEVMIVDSPLYYTFLGLLAASFISLFLAFNIFQGLDVLFRQACFFLLAVLVFHNVQTPEQMERLVGTMVLTGGIVAVIGLLQHNGIYSFGAPWNLPISTIGNVNFTAQYYNVVFPLAVAMLFVVRRLWAQVGVGAACFLMSCHLVVLGSRGGWLGASVALVLLVGIALLRHFQIGRRLVDAVIIFVVVVGLGWPVLTGMVGSIRIGADRNVNHLVNEYWGSMTRRVENAIRLEDDSSLQRVSLWEDTVRLIFDRPLLGVGIGNYEYSIPRFMSRESLEVKKRREAAVGQELMAYSAHNEYLEVWAETGLLGVVAFLILLLQVGGALVGLIRRYVQGQVGFLAIGLVAAVGATLTHSMFSTNLQQPASAVYFWLVVGLVWSLRLNVEWLTPLGLLATEARKVAIFLMVICGIVLMVSVVMGARTLVGELYYRRGELAFRQKAYAVAEGQWQTAISYSPTKYFRTYQALGTALYNQKKWPEAIEAFRKSLVYFPHNARVHHLLGRSLVKNGVAPEAITHLEQAVNLNPLVADFHLGLGEALVQMGKSADAFSVLDEALRLRPNDAEANQLSGAAHKQVGDLGAAVLAYQRVLQITPKQPDILNSLAVVYSEQGNFEGAREVFTQLVTQVPENLDYKFNLAVVLVGLAHYDTALEVLQQVLAQQPNFARAYVIQGQVFMALGMQDEAKQAFGEALRLMPNDPQLKQILTELGLE